MKLLQAEERLFRELGSNDGLAITLANQALLLGQRLSRWREALQLAEEASKIATLACLTTCSHWTKRALDEVCSHLGQVRDE